MFDWDVVIVGGGPAGLTAGLYLARANLRAVVLDKEGLGGYPKNVELIENYPGFPEGVSGAQLVSGMAAQATKYGLKSDLGEVTSVELFSSCRWVGCSNGRGYTTAVVIISGGARPKKLGVPGEDAFRGKGVFDCALCDGGQYADRVVAVCGGGDAAVTEALYMSKIASRVLLIHRRTELRSTGVLVERAKAQPNIEFVWNSVVERIEGRDRVESIALRSTESKQVSHIDVDGVLVHVGLEPNSDYLGGVLKLDDLGQIVVNERMETGSPYVLAAGDIRSGSPRQIAAAVGDGAIAAITAQRLLNELG